MLYSILNKKYDMDIPILKRFNLPCVGSHENFEDIRKERNKKYEKLKGNKKSKEYHEWFLQYTPAASKTQSQNKTRKSVSTKRNSSNKSLKNT